MEQRFDADADRAPRSGLHQLSGEEQLRPVTIARNYAEALFQLGSRAATLRSTPELLDAVAYAIGSTPRIEAVLMSPRITKGGEVPDLAAALPDAPRDFVLFLRGRGEARPAAVVRPDGVRSTWHWWTSNSDRVRAQVTIARPADDKLRKKIAQDLTRVIGKQVLPDFAVDPADPGWRYRPGGRSGARRVGAKETGSPAETVARAVGDSTAGRSWRLGV